jgi:hypothetical protein
MAQRANKDVAAAITRARSARPPTAADLYKHVYFEPVGQ